MKIKHREFLQSPTDSVHASTIAFFRKKPIFSWFGGIREGLADSSIYIKKGKDLVVIGSDVHVAFWNPILFPYDGQLFIFVKKGEFCDRWQTDIYDISNFKEPKKIGILPAGCNGPVKTKPLVHNDLIYCGSSVETRWDWTSYIETYKKDGDNFDCIYRTPPLVVPKKTFKIKTPYGQIVEKETSGIIQPSLWMDKYAKMNAFFRSSTALGRIYHSSVDMSGVNQPYSKWSDPKPTELLNPNSSVDTVYLNNRLFVVFNPSYKDRVPLVVAELDEEFKAKDYIIIRDNVDKTIGYNTVELSYPYMIDHNGDLHLTYTYGRKKIEYVVLEI